MTSRDLSSPDPLKGSLPASRSVRFSPPTRPDQNYPPLVDLMPLLTAFRKILPLALGLAVVVGAVVGGLASLEEPAYKVQTDIRIATADQTDRTPETMQTIASAYGATISDRSVQEAIESKTGQKVTLQGMSPSVNVGAAKTAGMLTITTQANSPQAARDLANAVVEAISRRATDIREETLRDSNAATQARIDLLQGEIDARLAADPRAQVMDLRNSIQEIRRTQEVQRLSFPTVTRISQTGGDAPSSPQPVMNGLVAGLATFMVAAVALSILRLRRSSRTDELWALRMNRKYGTTVERCTGRAATPNPQTEAAIAATLFEGGTVVLLGDVELPEELSRKARHSSAQGSIVHGAVDAPWWREVPPVAVGLGVVSVQDNAKGAAVARDAVAGLADAGVPTRIIIHS